MHQLIPTGVAAAAFTLAAVSSPVPAANDLVVPSGQVVVYDTASGPLALDNLIVEADGVLRVVGDQPFRVIALQSIRVDGRVDLSGSDAQGVQTLNTGNQPEVGAAGGPGGGRGGVGSRNTIGSTASGLSGKGPGAGLGGETGYGASSGNTDLRRPGGGGGGRFAADQPVSNIPADPANAGLVAEAGENGGASALGALSNQSPPLGGASGSPVFTDGMPDNDFFGVLQTPIGPIVGELGAPQAGSGGGAGGDAVPNPTFPNVNWQPASDEKGAGGGGGGGLGILQTRLFTMGPQGQLVADGGSGGGGENTIFFNRVGGGSGGGSGGMLLVQARLVDLSQASGQALRARGGAGGAGKNDQSGAINAGGDGGPGLIQVHVSDPALQLLLPPGTALEDLSSPSALVLQPVSGL